MTQFFLGTLLVVHSTLFSMAALTTGVPAELLIAQAYQESRLDPRAENWLGCRGIAQFRKETWLEFGSNDFKDAFNPELAIPAQARYMAWLHSYVEKKLGCQDPDWRWSLAAYTWGIGNVRQALRSGKEWNSLPRHVRAYVREILKNQELVSSKILNPYPLKIPR